MITVGIIIGSNRPHNHSRPIAEWIAQKLDHYAFTTQVIDLGKLNLPWLAEPQIPAKGHYQNQSTLDWQKIINGLDGIILVYPQYNWGYPAVLKNAIDTLYAEWADKPISTVVFGGHGGGQASAALSLVLQGIHARKMPVNLSLNINDDMFDQNGQLRNPSQSLGPYDNDVQALGQQFEHLSQ